MKSLRMLAVALLACACTASAALACDAHKSAKNTTAAKVTSAKASSACPAGGSAVTAAHAAHAGCTAEMAAACKSNASVAAAMGCETKGTTAVVASNARPAKPAAKGGDCCAMKGTSAAVAANGTSAAVAANGKVAGMDGCATGKGASTSASGLKSAVHDCAACADWTGCEQDVNSLGAKAQVVALKNGAMIVYTTDSPADVRALQSMVAKRHERLLAALSVGGAKNLCPECKALRGAIASGKLHREVVNVERGSMALLTSNDQSVVTRIRAMTGQPVAMR